MFSAAEIVVRLEYQRGKNTNLLVYLGYLCTNLH